MFSATTGLSKEPSSLIKMDEPEEQVNTRPAPKLPPLDNYLALNIQKQLNRAEINKAVDIRPPATAILTINSADRYPSLNERYNNPANGNPYVLTSPSDFTLNLGASLMNGNFTRIAVQSLYIDWTYPVICPATNGLYIYFQPGGTGAVTRYLVQLTPNTTSFYDCPSAPSTATGLQSAIRTATGSSTFTVNQNATYSNTYAFNSGNTDKFYFARWVSTTTPNTPTLFEFLGLSSQQVLATQQQGTNTLTTIYRFPYVDFVCETITANQSLRDASTGLGGSKTLLCRLYMAGDNVNGIKSSGLAPLFIQRNYTVPKQIVWTANQPIGGSLRFQLLDPQGNVLTNGANTNDLGGNLSPFSDANMGDWTLTLQVSEQ